MQPDRIEQRAAETILENGVRVSIPAPFFLRLFGKKTIKLKLRQPTLRTLMVVSSLALEAGFSFEGIDSGNLDAAHELIQTHAKTLARIVAVFILRKKRKIQLFSGMLANYLLDKTTSRKMAEIVLLIVAIGGVQDFTDSIRLIRSMRVTTPKNLSPTDQGSQQDEQ